METIKETSYKSIFKATSLFGGIQVYQILIGIIRSKLIAVILGPAGMGITGLFVSATSLIKSLSSMGLQSSAVRDVAAAYGSNDQDKINRTISVLRKLVWYTGFLGMIIVLILSPLLSKITFDSYDFTTSFILLSITLIVDQLTVGRNVIIQGTRKIKLLAKSSAIGSTFGLLITIPIYYFWGIDGIVPTLILHSILSFVIALYFSKKIKFSKVNVSNNEIFFEGRNMLKMGVAMSINGLLLTGIAYILRVFILRNNGQEFVGYFTAGFAILNTYVGMIFSAISTDFYPRLAAISQDNDKCRDVINKQGEIGLLIIAPCLVICLVFMPYVVILLYSNSFLPSIDYILWACIGMVFKLISWCISFQFIAKSEMKLFLFNEISVNIYSLIFNIIGFYYDGLRGLGIAFMLQYILYFIQVYYVSHKKFEYKFSKSLLSLFSKQLFLVIMTLFIVIFITDFFKYFLGVILIFISSAFSIIELNKRLNIKQILLRK